MSADGAADVTKSTFKHTCSVAIDIDASPDRVWSLLTDAARMPEWNTTVTHIEGTIAKGEKLRIRVPISARTFKVKVSGFEPARRMVWSDGQAPMFAGVRTFGLEPNGEGTRFSMSESFSGLMVPMIGRSLPDFKPVFEQYAVDLKKAAETATGGAT